jgi:hypothetical protein
MGPGCTAAVVGAPVVGAAVEAGAADDWSVDDPERDALRAVDVVASADVVASVDAELPDEAVAAAGPVPVAVVVVSTAAPVGATIATAAPDGAPDTGELSFFIDATTGASRMPASAMSPRRVRKGSRGPRAAERLGASGTSSPSNQESPPEARPLVRCDRVAEDVLWVRRPGW